MHLRREGERRRDDQLRKRIADMSPEEMRKTLLTSNVVNLPNRRAFDEAEDESPAPAVGRSDADGLKAFNDKFGYAIGDKLLQAKADALKAAGLDAYHEKGDEFLYRGDSVDDLGARLEKAREILRNTVIDVTIRGERAELKGVDFSYGTGKDLDEAEAGQHAHKAEREARGERARGELRGITETAGGQHHEPRSTAPEEVVASAQAVPDAEAVPSAESDAEPIAGKAANVSKPNLSDLRRDAARRR